MVSIRLSGKGWRFFLYMTDGIFPHISCKVLEPSINLVLALFLYSPEIRQADWSPAAWVHTWAPPFTKCLTLHKVPNPTIAQFSLL